MHAQVLVLLAYFATVTINYVVYANN